MKFIKLLNYSVLTILLSSQGYASRCASPPDGSDSPVFQLTAKESTFASIIHAANAFKRESDNREQELLAQLRRSEERNAQLQAQSTKVEADLTGEKERCTQLLDQLGIANVNNEELSAHLHRAVTVEYSLEHRNAQLQAQISQLEFQKQAMGNLVLKAMDSVKVSDAALTLANAGLASPVPKESSTVQYLAAQVSDSLLLEQFKNFDQRINLQVEQAQNNLNSAIEFLQKVADENLPTFCYESDVANLRIKLFQAEKQRADLWNLYSERRQLVYQKLSV